MFDLYRFVLRPLFFRLSAEHAHTVVAVALGVVHRVPLLQAIVARLWGVKAGKLQSHTVPPFQRPLSGLVGMAAGFDKNATMYNALGALGFSAVEVGTVTANPQPGNPKPRLFRLPIDNALINRMGFNNDGAVRVAKRIRACPPRSVLLGVNIGKSRATPMEDAAGDYAFSARLLAPLADYLVVNVSSPNTPGLRSLQSVEMLRPILESVKHACDSVGATPPLFVKIAPDLANDDVDAVARLALELNLSGIIACNTTISREGLQTDPATVTACGAGGLSGPVLRSRMLAVLARLHAIASSRLVLIAAGGISEHAHVEEALASGASFVQVYTAFIYNGPTFVRDLQDA